MRQNCEPCQRGETHCSGSVGWSNERVPRPLAAAVSVLIVIVAAVGVAGEHPWSGPQLLRGLFGHGVHVGDLVVLAVATLALAWTWRSVRRGD